MATVSAGQSVQLQIGAFDGLWVNCSGVGFIDFECKSRGTIQLTSQYQRIGYYGESVCVELRCVSGVIDYSTTPVAIELLTAKQAGDGSDSSPLDIKLTVNQLIDGATPFAKHAPVYQVTSSDAGGIAYTIASGNPAVTYENAPNGQPALKIVFNAFCQIEFPGMVNVPYDGHMYVQIYGSQTLTNLSTCRLRAFQSGAESNYRQGERTAISNALNSPYDVGNTAVTWHFSSVNTASIGAPPATFTASRYQLNLNPQAGQTATLYVFAVGVGQPRKSRICVVYDDGYDSAFKLGYQPFNSRGIKTTAAVIANRVGVAGYASLDTLKAYLGGGNALVAHGTSATDGSGNLFTAHDGSYQEAINDIAYNVDYMKKNGLMKQYAERCYIFPQGQWEKIANENTLLDMMLQKGFSIGRSALVGEATWCKNIDADTAQQRLVQPIIGHLWAGTTAAESTNIANIVSRIQSVANANGVDAFLMLHIVQPTSTADGSMSSIGIRVSDLNTIAAAIKTEIDAGKLEAVTMPDLVARAAFWNRM